MNAAKTPSAQCITQEPLAEMEDVHLRTLQKHWRGGHELFAADPIALEPGEGGGSFLLLTFSILIRPV